jgi:isoleucyl-tRNA synthetase
VEFIRGEFPPEMAPAYSVACDARRWVAIGTELTPELIAEGMSREIVRRLQNMRRAANFDIADYIVAYYQAKEPARQAVIDFADYIKQETLCRELVEESPPKEAYTEKVRISQCEVVFGVKLC